MNDFHDTTEMPDFDRTVWLVKKDPNGKKCAFIEASFPVNPTNFSVSIGEQVCISKIKNKLWEICGQYSIITGEKL